MTYKTLAWQTLVLLFVIALGDLSNRYIISMNSIYMGDLLYAGSVVFTFILLQLVLYIKPK